jgi:Uma2 family endonuclease
MPQAATSPDSPGKMTFEEFLDWADEDTRAEWVNGEVEIDMSPVSDEHQTVGAFLILLLGTFIHTRSLGVFRYESFQMRTAPDLPGRQPDILFVANDHLDRLKELYLDGPADLVVEIVSPTSVARDRGEKFDEYERGGVREYWIIDPQRKRAEFHILDAGGVYRAAAVDGEGRFHSVALPGFVLPVAWLWENPPIAEAVQAVGA